MVVVELLRKLVYIKTMWLLICRTARSHELASRDRTKNGTVRESNGTDGKDDGRDENRE